MIRSKPSTSLIQQKPRKIINIDLINHKSYNQFQGNSDIDPQQNHQNQTHHESTIYNNQMNVKQQKYFSINQQIQSNQQIYQLITQSNFKFKKVNSHPQNNLINKQQKIAKSIKTQNSLFPQIKFQQGTQPKLIKKQQSIPIKQSNSNTKQKQKTKHQPSSNWKKFLQESKPTTLHNKSKSSQLQSKINESNSIQPSKFISIDCQFVKCGQQDQLARISIVSQNGLTLYDSYIKPSKKVTDFLTDITGITYSHIKNAPEWKQQISKVKKILLGKILVGHTLHKDLEVTKLNDWKGISHQVDISQFSNYKENGGSKVVSLKRMALSFLNKNIQSGWHSSVQDAVTTMELFKLNKKKILKQLKLI